MAGRPIAPTDFLGEEEIAVLRQKLRELYDLFVEESDIDAWRQVEPGRRREELKRNANQSLLMMKPLTVIVDNLCKQYSGHDDAADEAAKIAAEIAKHEKLAKR